MFPEKVLISGKEAVRKPDEEEGGAHKSDPARAAELPVPALGACARVVAGHAGHDRLLALPDAARVVVPHISGHGSLLR